MSEKSEALRRYEKLQKQLKQFTSEHDKAQGAFEQQMGLLKEKYDCDTLDEARDLLDRLENEGKQAEKKFKKAVDKFDGRWSDKLTGVGE